MISFINHKGGTHSKVLSDLALQTWTWYIQRSITICAEHIPGVDNVGADRESRKQLGLAEWKLNQWLFARINAKWGPLEVDLFAARHNHQLQRYFSYGPDLETEAVDALAQNLEESETLRISPIQPSREVPQENSSGESPDSSNNSTSLAGSIMVSSPAGKHSRLSCTPPTLSSDVGESNGPSSPSGTEQLPTFGHLESVRRSMQTEGISEEAFEIISSSWRQSTEKSYSSAWKSGWAGVRNGIWIHFQSV